MSAQRRATTKQQPVVPASESSKSRATKSTKTNQRADTTQDSRRKASPGGQPQTQGRRSVLATRWQTLRKMIQDTWAEIKKVVWPDWPTTRNLTLLVIIMATVLGILLGGIDFVLLRVFEAF
jgi:preprotein translocase subunit SecE